MGMCHSYSLSSYLHVFTYFFYIRTYVYYVHWMKSICLSTELRTFPTQCFLTLYIVHSYYILYILPPVPCGVVHMYVQWARDIVKSSTFRSGHGDMYFMYIHTYISNCIQYMYCMVYTFQCTAHRPDAHVCEYILWSSGKQYMCTDSLPDKVAHFLIQLARITETSGKSFKPLPSGNSAGIQRNGSTSEGDILSLVSLSIVCSTVYLLYAWMHTTAYVHTYVYSIIIYMQLCTYCTYVHMYYINVYTTVCNCVYICRCNCVYTCIYCMYIQL